MSSPELLVAYNRVVDLDEAEELLQASIAGVGSFAIHNSEQGCLYSGEFIEEVVGKIDPYFVPVMERVGFSFGANGRTLDAPGPQVFESGASREFGVNVAFFRGMSKHNLIEDNDFVWSYWRRLLPVQTDNIWEYFHDTLGEHSPVALLGGDVLLGLLSSSLERKLGLRSIDAMVRSLDMFTDKMTQSLRPNPGVDKEGLRGELLYEARNLGIKKGEVDDVFSYCRERYKVLIS